MATDPQKWERGKKLALITELFWTYMEPLFYVSRGKTGEAGAGKRDYQYQKRICRTIRKCTALCYILVRIFFGFITFLQIPSDLGVRYQATNIVGVILSFIW
jgi:hypothetical protein